MHKTTVATLRMIRAGNVRLGQAVRPQLRISSSPAFNSMQRQEPMNRETRRHYMQTRCVEDGVSITYVEADGTEHKVDANLGENLMDVAHENNVELEGACGGELACSTCHLIFEQDVYDNLPEKEEEEDDMLDLAFEVTETSRLGCQILVKEEFEGMTVRIPDDGFG